MSLDELIAYVVACAGVTTVLVSLLDQIAVTPAHLSDGQRNGLLRGANYVFNLGLILMVVLTHHVFDWQNLFIYISLAFGQAIGSHTAYKTVAAPVAQTTTVFLGAAQGHGSEAQPVLADGGSANATSDATLSQPENTPESVI